MAQTLFSAIATMADLRERLAEIDRCLTLDELKAFAATIAIDRKALDGLLHFDAAHFAYTTLIQSETFEVNCIGWRPGQVSDVHDHRGSVCCVCVIEGVLSNTDFIRDAHGHCVPAETMELNRGQILARQDDQIHQLANRDRSGNDLVTLHLYSPPLIPLAERRWRRSP